MKEIVDRILNGEAVDIAGDFDEFYISVLKDGCRYKVAFCSPDEINEDCQELSEIDIKEAGKYLIALADELESRKKFRTNEDVYYIRANGEICPFTFFESNSFHLSLLATGNAFKTIEEAEANKDAILAKYQDLRDRVLV